MTAYISACECDPLGRGFSVSDSSALACRLIPFSGQGQKDMPCPRGHHHVRSLAVSADGSRLLLSRGPVTLHQLECWATGDEPFIPVWGFRDGQQVDPLVAPRFENHTWGFFAVALSPDGRLAAVVETREDAPAAVGGRLESARC